jgi:glycosyltransferase involved in cell wall biosynthesis
MSTLSSSAGPADVSPPAPATRSLRTLSCVVPAHDEGEGLRAFVQELARSVAPLAERCEIVVVDDGSGDGSVEALLPLAPALGLQVLRLSRNFGKEAALTAGLRAARGQAVLLIDADFQHPLELVPRFVELWRAGCPMVYGIQQRRVSRNPLRRAASRAYHRLMTGMGEVPIPPDAGDFRLLDRACVDALLALPERNRYMKGMYAWIGFPAVGVPFTPAARRHGRTRFSLRALARLGLTGLVAFSNVPLRLVSAAGLLVSLAALAYAGYILFEWAFLGQPIVGFTTLAASILLGTGLQLIGLGVLGEYLARVYTEVKQRPDYIVAAHCDCSPLAADAAAAATFDAADRPAGDAR